jgi:hypothetical protein
MRQDPENPAADNIPEAAPDWSQTMKVGEFTDVPAGIGWPSISTSDPSIVTVQMITIGVGSEYLMFAVAVGEAIVTLSYLDGSATKITVTVIPA